MCLSVANELLFVVTLALVATKLMFEEQNDGCYDIVWVLQTVKSWVYDNVGYSESQKLKSHFYLRQVKDGFLAVSKWASRHLASSLAH